MLWEKGLRPRDLEVRKTAAQFYYLGQLAVYDSWTILP